MLIFGDLPVSAIIFVTIVWGVSSLCRRKVSFGITKQPLLVALICEVHLKGGIWGPSFKYITQGEEALPLADVLLGFEPSPLFFQAGEQD